MKGKHFKEEPQMGLIGKIFILVCMIVFLYSAYKVLFWVKSNRDLRKLENDIFAEVVKKIEKEDNEEVAKTIDFTKLNQINKDVIAWISIDNTEINYPILQTNNNEYYLKKDLYKKNSSCGSIFLDCDTNKDFSEQNTVIYGHHLKSGGMFTELDKIYEGKLGSEVYIQIYTLENSYTYQVIASYVSKPSLEIVKKNFNATEREKYIEKALKSSKIKFNQLANTAENMLTLITCHGTQRTVVNAIRIK